ncbi:MAG: putative lipid II flippase FtsW [Patescibacteria group bacterium]
MRSGISTAHSIDYKLLGLVLLLTSFGLVMLTSASNVLGFERFGDTYYFTKQQLLNVAIGLIAMFVSARFPPSVWQKIAFPAFAVTMLLLVCVFIPGIGVSIHNARSWIDVGVSTLQPSEIAKLTFLLYLSVWFKKRKAHLRSTLFGLLPFLTLLGALTLLVLLQPDPGTAAILILMSLGVYYAAGARISHLVSLFCIASILFAAAIIISPYRTERIAVFLSPEKDPRGVGYHLHQSMIAIGSGGWWGLGLGKSRQKFSYLPESAGDSIFAVMGEEGGFMLSGGFIVVLSVLLHRLFRIAARAPDEFSRLFVVGVILWIGVQSFVNMAAMMGLIPLTGLPLPLVSFGGSAILSLLGALGVCLSISRTTVIKA